MILYDHRPSRTVMINQKKFLQLAEISSKHEEVQELTIVMVCGMLFVVRICFIFRVSRGKSFLPIQITTASCLNSNLVKYRSILNTNLIQAKIMEISLSASMFLYNRPLKKKIPYSLIFYFSGISKLGTSC